MGDHSLDLDIDQSIDGLVQIIAQKADDQIVDTADLLSEWRVLGQILTDHVDNRLNSVEQSISELLLGVSNESALWANTEKAASTADELAELTLPEVEDC